MNDLPPALPGGHLPVPVDGVHRISPIERERYGREPSLLAHYWSLVKRDRWIIAAIIIACLAIALIHGLLAERMYTASTRIQIDRESARITGLEGLEQSSDIYNFEFYQTQLELLESRTLSENVARELQLADDAAFLFPDLASDEAAEELAAMDRDERLYQATEIVRGGTAIDPVPGSSVFAIRHVSSDPKRAASIANATADQFIQTSLQRRFEATAHAREFLQDRLQTTRERLEESEREANAYARREGLISLSGRDGPDRALVSNDLEQLSARLAAARAARIDAEADFRNNRDGAAASNNLTNMTVNQLRQQRGTLMAELGKLENSFGPDYPRVRDLRAQLTVLGEQIAAEEGRIGTNVSRSLGAEYRAAVAAEGQLQAQVDRLKRQLLDENDRSVGYQILQRDVDTNRALYDALLQRFKEVGIAGGVGANNVTIVDRALVPRGPSSPNIPMNMLLALMVGLVASAGTVLVREQMDDTVVLPSEFDNKLGAPLLGTTPRLAKAAVSGELDREKSALTEAYYSTLTSIQYSSSKGAPPSLLVTSTQSNEGKSTTAFALARDLANVGKTVLLVDADMRNPSLHKVHGLDLANGLSDILTGNASLNETVHASEHANLSMMTAGTSPPSPAELLSGDDFRTLLAQATKQFDHVVVDGPPVLGLADAPLLARSVDGTVFVLEHGRTRATQARLAMNRLESVHARILGAVLTKFDAKGAGYADGYGYDYRYDKGDAADAG
ncbi:GumC family protein [Sphingomicrobium flavum]|uniref:GumC family protein n=1 Tax=Sphingomicrobium flavum TaxID=1229164 RepID=UPI0021AD89F9|nr:polysaccharide biosynthesis tyrosine autokinase [Sphingomicrobium flavum]